MLINNLTKDHFKPDENIRAFFCNADDEAAVYSADFWELAYVYEGEGVLRSNAGSEDIKAGQFVLVSPGARHSVCERNEHRGAAVRLCRCIFTREYFEAAKKSCSEIEGIDAYALFALFRERISFCVRLSDDRRSNIRNLIWLIAHEYGHKTTGSEAVMQHSLVSLLVCISRLYENRINEYVETPTDWIIRDITDYIKTNFGYKITLQDLSDRVHLSREHISRYFKQRTGKTISQFLLETRIERAADKIRKTNIPISDIAEYCGYSSTSNFQKAFRRITGQSPVEYRKTHKIITKQ